MFATKLIIEIVGKTDKVKIFKREYETPQDLCYIHTELWQKVGRQPVACFLSAGTARVIFQEGRRATDTLDSLEDLVRIALKEDE